MCAAETVTDLQQQKYIFPLILKNDISLSECS